MFLLLLASPPFHRISASHLASSVVSLLLLASPNLTTHDIPPPSHRCNSHAWYGPALYLKMSVSPPAFSMCEARWRLRGERVRRSTAVQIMNAPLVTESAAHSQFGPLPAPTVLRNNNMHAVNTHTVNMSPAWSKAHRTIAFGVSLAKLQKCILVCRSWKFPSSTWFCIILYA